MHSSYFRFKQFTIRHDHSAMKVGTDGVLLGAWASINHTDTRSPRVLDVGTGTGLIAMMLAQRFPHTRIEGIDIDEASIEQAKENIKASPFHRQIELRKQDFSDLHSFSNKYHLIISNPPFYIEETLGGNDARDKARHATFLPFEKLVHNASFLLEEGGLFCVIIPHKSAPDFISLCAANGLYLTRRTDVRSTERKSFNRTLLEFGKSILPSTTNTLTLHDAQNQRTPEYKKLTEAFYI